MSIWTFSRSASAGLICLALAACDGGGAGFLDGLQALGQGGEARANSALSRAKMMQGAIVLVPPQGYCIDRRSLTQEFAVLARCDSLGGGRAAQGASLGFLSVSLTPVTGDVDLGNALKQSLPEGAKVQSQTQYASSSIAQVSGGNPVGSDPDHWRGLSQLSGHLMLTGAYAPVGGGLAGQVVLEDLITETRAASAPLDTNQQNSTNAGTQRTGLGGLLSGLFNRKP